MTVRRGRNLAGLTLMVLLILAGSMLVHYRGALCADPVRCHFVGFSSKEVDQIKVYFLNRNGDIYSMPRLRSYGCPYWCIENWWIRDLCVQIPSELLEDSTREARRRLDITIGERNYSFSGGHIPNWKTIRPSPTDILRVVPIASVTTSVPWLGGRLNNWPGDMRFLYAAAQDALLPSLLVMLFCSFLSWKASPTGQNWCRHLLGVGVTKAENASPDTPNLPTLSPGSAWFWNWGGFIFLICMLVFLEIRQPYYFTQSDNLWECFPVMLEGCRSIWLGQFPDYNPYLFLGAPLASLGLYALTYPPTLLSYALARHLLGDEYATLEVFAFLHIFAGFFATRLLGRKLGLSGLPCNLVAISFVLSGSVLIVGRSWFNFLPILVWLPLLILGLLRLLQPCARGRAAPVSCGWVIGMGLAIGLPCHLGFPQVALYLTGFVCLAGVYLAAAGAMPSRRLLFLLAAIVVGIGIAMPIIFQQWLVSRDVTRHIGPNVHKGIAPGLPAMLLPYPLVRAEAPGRWGNEYVECMGHMYFFGGFLAFLFFFQLVGLVVYRPRGRDWAGQVWTFCGLVALVLALGDTAGLWNLVNMLPVIGRINRHPLRLLPFLAFFASLSGGLVLERFLAFHRRSENPAQASRFRGRPFELLVALPAVLLLLVHVYQCRTAFHMGSFVPYPELPAAVKARLWQDGQPTGRACSWGVFSRNEASAWHLPDNLAAVYQIPTDQGVCPLLEKHAMFLPMWGKLIDSPGKTMKAYGERWHLKQDEDHLTADGTVFSNTWKNDVLSREEDARYSYSFDSLRRVVHARGMILAEFPGAVDPLAFAETRPDQPLPLKLHGRGIDVDLSSFAGGPAVVVVNFLNYPYMHAFVDGNPSPCKSDEWKRINVTVPAQANLLEVRYCPPWSLGLWLGVFVTAAGLFLLWFAGRDANRGPKEEKRIEEKGQEEKVEEKEEGKGTSSIPQTTENVTFSA